MNRYIHAILCITFSMFIAASYAQAPVANFSASTTSGCSPIVSNFTDLSTNTPTSWFWDLGNGTTSTLKNPSTTYFAAGTYTVKLTVTNASGSDTKTLTNYITVAPSPVVAFTADSSSSCSLPRTISFTDYSVPGGSGTASYLWDFGDGTTSTAQNPAKTYTSAGNYTVVLLVTNGNGCSNSLSKPGYIKNSAKPSAQFSAASTAFCSVPATAVFTNLTGSGVSYAWDFGDGGTSTATNPSHTYSSLGSYSVTLVSTSAAGCKDTITKSSYISIAHPAAAFSASTTSGCAGKSITLSNTSTPSTATYAWDFGDGTTSTVKSPGKAYTTSGSYSIRLIATNNGCSDTAYQTVSIGVTPRANFGGGPFTGCNIPHSVSFTNLSGVASYFWSFGDGGTSTSTSPTHTYTAFGSYNAILVATGSNGCSDTTNAAINIQKPTATITTNNFSGCAPINVSFTANVTTLIPVSNYSWDFGDGSSPVSCASCPTQNHTYTTPGSYTAVLTYTTGSGCTYAATKNITISTKPTASFSASPTTICPQANVTFTNSSTGASSYTWFFGDGGTSTASNPVYSGYQYPPGGGPYTVTLIANNNGCKDTMVKSNYITVNPPLAKFGMTVSCANHFFVSLSDSSLGASSYSWNWGDGNTSTQSGGTLSHTYASSGTYTITLTVTNSTSGCSNTTTKTVVVQPLVANFYSSDTTVCKGEFFTTIPTSTGAGLSYYYDMGATSFPYSSSPFTYAYNTPGIYSVKQVITDIYGCKDSLIKTNYIHVGGPTVAFSASPTTGCLPLTVNFTDNSTPNGGFAITSRSWYIGYGPYPTITTSSSTTSFTYVNGGQWDVVLIATDANGCKDSLRKTNYINTSRPVAQFYTNDTIVCVGKPVVITNNSGGNSFTCMWYWGDGSTSTQLTPTHTYSASGVYTIKLVITDALGCKDSMTKTSYVTVLAPYVDFAMSDTAANCPPLTVNFTNNSTSVSSYAWTFDNASYSSLTNPSTLYTYPGTYHIKLVGTSPGGCKDSVTKDVVVHGPTGTFTYSPLSGCTPMTVSFSATTSGATQLIWDMNNGVTQNTSISTFSYTYTQTGKYVPKLILSDGASCLVPVQGLDTIRVDHTDADFSYSSTGNCVSSTVQFKDTLLSTLSPVSSISWVFGDGGSSTSHNPSHIYTTAGNFNVRMIVTNTQGCQDTTIKTIIIHGLPNVTAANSQTICQGTTVPVTITASGASTYVWTPTGGLSCTTCASPNALPTATTTYVVTGTDTSGCTDTGAVTITVAPLPNVTATANTTTICNGSSATLTANGASGYVWTPAGSLSCSTCASTTATPTATTTYIVTGTDGNGCADTSVVSINVNAKPTVNAGPDQTICSGSSVPLSASGAASYVWTPATGLSCTSCANPTANPTTTTTYVVTGANSAGCTATDTMIVNVNPKPGVSAGSNVSACSGTSVILTATGASSYVWSPATGLSCTACASPMALPSSTITYTVTGTDANGCTNTANVTVSVGALPNVTASPDVSICNGSSTSLTGYGAVSYVWTPSTGLSCTSCTTTNASPGSTTTYIVTGTAANGCTDTGVVTVTVNAKPVVTASADQTICNGSSASLTASGATSYAWSPATGLSCTSCANPTASPSTTTTYTVTGTNANGCTNTATTTITVNPKPSVTAGSNVAICSGSSTTLTAMGATSYTWTPSATLSCNNCASPTATPTANTTYTVTGTDAKGCVNTANVTVAVNPLPVVTASGTKTICAGDNAPLQAAGATTYAWTPATGLSCTACSNPIATPASTTTYTVTGTTNGCTGTATATVTVRPLPVITAGGDKNICIGTGTALQATGGVSYTWSPATGLSCTTCSNPNANPTSTTTYTISGTDGDGCSNSATITVNVNPLPVINAGPDQIICVGSIAQLNATGGVVYLWSGGSQLSCVSCPNPTVSPTDKTIYTVKGTDAKGCSNTDDVTISVIDKKPINVGPGDSICKGESVVLHADGGSSYQWSPPDGLNDPTSSDPIASPDYTTTYQLTVKQGDCFTQTSYVTIIVHDLPTVSLGDDVTIGGGNSIQLNAKTNMPVQYSWSPPEYLSCTDCQGPVASPLKTTNYVATVTNEWGCQAKDDITIHVTCDNSQVFVANTFTPNNDGVNDRFFPQGKGITTVKSFTVYNRWGEVVFSREDMPLNNEPAGWDGMYKGAPAKPDVFVYIIQAQCESGELLNLKGDISLIR